jgi:hypothetical protein
MDNTNNSIEETLTQDTEADIEIDLDDNQDIEIEVDWKAEAEKKTRAYEDQKKRAEIAESKLNKSKTTSTQAPVAKNDNLSTVDTIALMKADVDTEDISTVIEYANFKKISVADALKSAGLKAELAEKAEKRNVAQATNIGTTRRANSTMSDDVLLNKASKGELPDSEDAIKRLNNLRWGIKG